MHTKIKRLLAEISHAASALRYADAGEFSPRGDKERLLGTIPAQPPAAPARPAEQPRRRVALLAERRLGTASLRYALNVCERIGAELEILTGPGVGELAEQVRPALKHRAIRYRQLTLEGEFLDAVRRHTRTSSGLMFVVASTDGDLAEQVANAGFGPLRTLGEVPWVMVAEERSAA